jgi:hypothetical protein
MDVATENQELKGVHFINIFNRWESTIGRIMGI